MKTRLLFALLLSNLISFGQTSEMLVDTTKLWSNLWQSASGSPPPHITRTSFIRFSGDTLIGPNHFTKVFESTDSLQVNYLAKGYIREETSGKVFYRTLYDTTIRLLYDFNVEVGDSITIWGYLPVNLVVDTVDSVLINNKYLKRIILSYNGCSGEQWIEGIGSLCGVLQSGAYCITGGIFDLLCYYENDALIYSDPGYAACYYNSVGIGDGTTNETGVILFPNPAAGYLMVETQYKHGKQTIQILSRTGQVVYTDPDYTGAPINTSGLRDGMYLLKFTDENRFAVKKFVVKH